MKNRSLKRVSAKNKYFLYLFLALMFIFLLLFTIFKVFKSDFKVESRIDKVSLYQKEKDKDSGYETIGWLKVQGTNIDLPIIFAPEYNLSSIVEQFAWSETVYKGINNIMFITGHNIKNLSSNPLINGSGHERFEPLMSFTYYDFVKDNQFFQYTQDGKDYVYQIFSVAYLDPNEIDVYNDKRFSEKEMNDYLKLVNDKSLYDFNIDVDSNDRIMSLVTCSRMFGVTDKKNFVVSGRLVNKYDAKKLSKNVTETSNYDKLKKIWKDVNTNEDA